MNFFKNPNYDFVRWRWHAIALSLVVILAGLSLIATRGLQKGVDFEGGTIVILKFDQQPDLSRIRGALGSRMPGGGDAVVQNYGPAENQHGDDPRAPHRPGGRRRSEQGSRRRSSRRSSRATSAASRCRRKGTEIVGPVVGEQLRRQGILATVLALAGHPGLHRAALPVELRRRRDRRDAARPARSAWRSWRSSGTTSRSTSSPAC